MLLKWIQDINETCKKESKLVLNIVTRLMKNSAGIESGRYGHSKK